MDPHGSAYLTDGQMAAYMAAQPPDERLIYTIIVTGASDVKPPQDASGPAHRNLRRRHIDQSKLSVEQAVDMYEVAAAEANCGLHVVVLPVIKHPDEVLASQEAIVQLRGPAAALEKCLTLVESMSTDA